ncbi:MAG: radical SAM family heme chaperone HemW [Bacteroidia bacterium]
MSESIQSSLGLYIHIPYCKQACSYCNFYFSTQLGSIDNLVNAICNEIENRIDFWPKRSLKTIYFGGGTPSILSKTHLTHIFKAINSVYDTLNCSEITFECNPDDVSEEKLKQWRDIGINRLSIGIQSFYKTHLELINRSHNAEQAIKAIEQAKIAGFNDITIDLIYGIPQQTDEQLKENLNWIKKFSIPHFSAYALTVEPKTLLAHQVAKGIIEETDDETFKRHFEIIKSFAVQNDFEHYEISNFSKKGKRAIHNSAYWNGEPYLGVGPAAHSFDGNNRYWNVANLHNYIKGVANRDKYFEMENLSIADKYNEYLLTKLRTIEGVSFSTISANYEPYKKHFLTKTQSLINKGWLKNDKDTFVLTDEGQFLCDHITTELMIE